MHARFLAPALLLAAILAAGCGSKGPSPAPRNATQVADAAPASTRILPTPFFGSVLHAPSGPGPHPAVLLLHGSEGGRGLAQGVALDAKDLAERGYAALALCYFDCVSQGAGTLDAAAEADRATIPAKLARIDLGRTYRALQWLKQSSAVQGQRLALFGVSRGGEQALLLASYLAQRPGALKPDALMAHSVISDIGPTYDPEAPDQSDEIPPGSPAAWIWPSPPTAELTPRQGELDLFAPIELHRFGGPILITQGTRDELFPIDIGARAFETSLRAAGRKVRTQNHTFTRPKPACGDNGGNGSGNMPLIDPDTDATAEIHYLIDDCHILNEQSLPLVLGLWDAFLGHYVRP